MRPDSEGVDELLKQGFIRWISVVTVGAMACPAFGWGPETQRSVVFSAGHVFSRSSSIPLVNLIDYVHEGAGISDSEDRVLFLEFGVDPVRSIQREMFLLQGVKSNRVDPYFAYRMGALGKKIVELVAPMRDGNAPVRERYYADVEEQIGRVRLQLSTRNLVEPQLYFARLLRQAKENDSAIVVDYRSGLGIDGIAGKLLTKDASRAVDAVVDVWYTIFRSQVNSVDISKTDMRKYMLSAIDFYLKNSNIAEVNDVYVRAKAKRVLTPNMKRIIGDLYYDNGYFDEALMVYGELLAENPGLREVSKRIAEYHVSVGEEALANQNLEDARDAFALAVRSDVLHPEAQRKLVLTNRAIEKRQDRFAHQQELIELAQRSEMDAEDSEMRRDYARSIQYLRASERNYNEVTGEFPGLRRQANVGSRSIQIRLIQLKKALVDNAQLLSGSGFSFDAKQLASGVGDTSREAMISTLKADYRRMLEEISGEIVIP